MAVVFPSNSSVFWREISSQEDSGVIQVHRKLHLSFPPYYLADLKKSVKSVLDSRLTCYEPDLGGILATYGRIAILKSEGGTLFNLSEIHVDVEGDFYVFSPQINQQLVGVVNSKSEAHVGCLVHGVFNVSLPFRGPKSAVKKLPLKSVEVGDKVKLEVVKLDLESQVPYIEGKFLEKIESQAEDNLVEMSSQNLTQSTEKKKSKLSLSQRKKQSEFQTESPNDPVEVKTNGLHSPGQRKRKLTSDSSPVQETPKNKKIKHSTDGDKNDGDEGTAFDSIVTNLFSVISRKQELNNQKKNNTKHVSVPATDNAPVRPTESIQRVSIPEELSSKVLKELESKTTTKKKNKMVNNDQKPEVSQDICISPVKKASGLELRDESEKVIISNDADEHQPKVKSPKKTKAKKRPKEKEAEKSLTIIETEEQVDDSPEQVDSSVVIVQNSKTVVEDQKEVSSSDIAQTTPRVKSKKKSKVKKEDDEDHESIIKELLESSLGCLTPKSTHKSKSTVKSSKASSAKETVQKATVPSSDKLIETPSAKGSKTPSSGKKPKISAEKKTSKFVAEKFDVPDTPLEVSSPLKKPKKDKVKKSGAAVKKNKEEVSKEENDSDDGFDQEAAIRNIMKLVQPKEKSKNKLTEPKKKRQRN